MSVFEGIKDGLQEAIDFEQGKKKLRTKTVKILPAPSYSKEEVKQIRFSFGLTQSTFAALVGVSPKTVEAWESGRNKPSGSSGRLLQIFEKNPDIIEEQDFFVIK